MSPTEGDELAAALADPRPRRAHRAMVTAHRHFAEDPHGTVPWVRRHQPVVEAYARRPDLPEDHRGEIAGFYAHVLLLDLVYRFPDLPHHLATGTPLAQPLPPEQVAGAARLAALGLRLRPSANESRWPKAMADLIEGRAEEADGLLVLLDHTGPGEHRALALAVRALAELRRGDARSAQRLADAARRTPAGGEVANDVALLLGGLDGTAAAGSPAPEARVVPVPLARPAAPLPSPAPSPAARRSSSTGRLVVSALVGTLLGLLVVSGGLGRLVGLLPDRDPGGDGSRPAPSAEIVALADRMRLTDEGRRIFYGAEPEIVDAAAVQAQCRDASDRPGDTWAGCYDSRSGISVYAPADPRLARSTVQTAAHELLHAVFDGLDADERDDVARLLSREMDRLPRTHPIRERIDTSTRRDEGHRATEQFAYLGTEIMPEGGFAPALEKVYARYLADRSAVVRNSRRAEAVLTDTWDRVGRVENRNAHLWARYQQDRADYDQLRSLYEEYREQQRSIAGDPSRRIEVGWAEAGEEPVMRPLDEAIPLLAEDLARRSADLKARRSDLVKRDARAARLRADAEALTVDAVPGATGKPISGSR